MLVAAARGLRAEIPAETPAVLLGHWSSAGASTPTGAMTDDFREVVLDVDELTASVRRGRRRPHPQAAGGSLGGRRRRAGPFFYTGSPLPVDFGEARREHGVYIWSTTSTSSRRREFVPIESRPFVTVDVDLTTDRHEELGVDETDAVAAAIATRLSARRRGREDPLPGDGGAGTPDRLAEAPHAPRRLPQGVRDHGDIVRSERARVDGMDEGSRRSSRSGRGATRTRSPMLRRSRI
jgi:hypothetical protein